MYYHIRKHWPTYLVAVALIAVIVCICIFVHNDNKTVKHYDLTDPKQIELNKIAAKNAEYVTETVYDGANVPYLLYSYAFTPSQSKNVIVDSAGGVAEDSWLTNEDLVKRLGANWARLYVDQGEKFLNTLLGSNYRDIQSNPDEFGQHIYELYGNSSQITSSTIDEDMLNEDGYIDAQAFINEIIEMYADNEMSIELKYMSDKSLVWYKNYTYWSRAAIQITPTSTKYLSGSTCEALRDVFGLEINYGETKEYYVDIMYAPTQQRYIMSYEIKSIE